MAHDKNILEELSDHLIKNIRAGKYEINTDCPIDRKTLALLDLLIELEIISSHTVIKWKNKCKK